MTRSVELSNITTTHREDAALDTVQTRIVRTAVRQFSREIRDRQIDQILTYLINIAEDAHQGTLNGESKKSYVMNIFTEVLNRMQLDTELKDFLLASANGLIDFAVAQDKEKFRGFSEEEVENMANSIAADFQDGFQASDIPNMISRVYEITKRLPTTDREVIKSCSVSLANKILEKIIPNDVIRESLSMLLPSAVNLADIAIHGLYERIQTCCRKCC